MFDQGSALFRGYLFRIGSGPSAFCFASSAEVREDHHNEMGREPNIVVTHILINVDKDEHSRHEHPEQNVRPLRDGVGREHLRVREQIHDHHDPRKEK